MGLRNFCINCQVELVSEVVSGNLDLGCQCSDAEGNENRCCEKCHNEHHSPDKMACYDDETYADE
jgi:hypothetical protein